MSRDDAAGRGTRFPGCNDLLAKVNDLHARASLFGWIVAALLLIVAGFQIAGSVNREIAKSRAKACFARNEDDRIAAITVSGCVDAARLGLLDKDGLLVGDTDDDFGGFEP